MKDLKERTLRGGLVTIFGQSATFLLRMASLVVLARLLTPRDFGLVGMVTAVTGVLAIFKDAGLSMVTVQRATITQEQTSTLFWLNVLMGVMLFGVSLAIAPVLVAFYRESRLLWVTAALASGFVFNGAAAQHGALLSRQMRFATLVTIDLLSWSVSIGVAIVMAATGYGYWALVGMNVTSPAIAGVLLWLAARWIPGRPRRKVGAMSMLRFGGTLSLNSLIVYLAQNADRVLVGRFCGAEALGIYGRAFQLIRVPTDTINAAIGSVAFPALSRIQDDAQRFKNYFLKGYSLVLALTLPATIACALFADDLILVVLGPSWTEVAPIFRLLTPTVLTFALVNPFSIHILSMGRVAKILKMSIVATPVLIAGYSLGLRYGPNGVAFGYSASITLLIVPLIAWAKHGTLISWRDILRAMSPSLLSALVAGSATFAASSFCRYTFFPLPRLLLGGTFFIAIYLVMLLKVMGQKAFYADLLRALRTRHPAADKDSDAVRHVSSLVS